MYPYIPNTKDDEQRMLEFMGLNSVEDLFSDIPSDVKLKGDLDLAPSKSELEVASYLTELSKSNSTINDLTCFLGAGAYDHYIPSIVGGISLQEVNSIHPIPISSRNKPRYFTIYI